MGSLRDRQVACLAFQISNPVSGGQCHLSHLTTLRMTPGLLICEHRWPKTLFISFLTSKVHPGPRVVVSTAAFHARVRGSVPGLGALKKTKMFLPHPRVKVSIVGSLRDQEVACSASDRSNFESCVWGTVSSQSSHHPQEVLLAQFSLYVHSGGLKPDSFHFLKYIFALDELKKYKVDRSIFGLYKQYTLNNIGSSERTLQYYYHAAQENPCRVILWLNSNSTEGFFLNNLYCLECICVVMVKAYNYVTGLLYEGQTIQTNPF